MSGRKYRVTADDPRYDEWPSRKPSKRSKLAAKIREQPLEYAAERGRKVAESTARTALGRTSRALAGGGAATVARALILPAAAIAASAGILATGYVLADRIAKGQQRTLGDRLNAISRQFVDTQNQVIRKLGVRSWAEVPEELRRKALADYKRAIATATAQAQGSAFVGVRESYK